MSTCIVHADIGVYYSSSLFQQQNSHSHPDCCRHRMGWDGMGWDGMGWDGMGWDGMGWDGMGWDGIYINR